jgi:hypothetical protein
MYRSRQIHIRKEQGLYEGRNKGRTVGRRKKRIKDGTRWSLADGIRMGKGGRDSLTSSEREQHFRITARV